MRARRARRKWIGLSAAAFALMAALLVVTADERGLFVPAAESASTALPGFTLADETGSAPVVTSLRSGGEAQREGLRVGDRIDAVDGTPVRSVAGLRAALSDADLATPVALHVARGDAVWQVVLDRDASEPAVAGRRAHDSQNIAG